MTHVSTPTLARWLVPQVEYIRHHEAGGEILDELRAAIGNVRHVLDRPADRWYAGRCGDTGGEGGPCGDDLYATTGARLVTCRGCGATYDAEERKRWLLEVVEDVLANAAEAARALTRLAMPVTSAAIRGYARRGRLEARGHDRAGNPTYRLGDVIDLLVDEMANAGRTDDRGARARRATPRSDIRLVPASRASAG